MVETITVSEGLSLEDVLWVDVRTPLEFEKGSIPGAVNLPLFSNQERHQVGILYQQDPREARSYGLNLVAPRIPSLVHQMVEIAPGKTLILYCFRGGMRSSGLATILELMGVSVLQLAGGYKAFRQYVVNALPEALSQLPEPVVIYGLTGSGKTDLIRMVKSCSYPAVDLEELALHRGSAFGRIGVKKRQNQRDFEALLLQELNTYARAPYLILEAESKNIGPVTLPPLLQEKMQQGKKVLLKSPLPRRIERILVEYAAIGQDCIPQAIAALERLTKKLGKGRVASLQHLLRQGEMEEVVAYLLEHYYDPLYQKSMAEKEYLLLLEEEHLVSSSKILINTLEALYC